jgi:hypothetical protein
LAISVLPTPASALSLEEARSSGLVGETARGYIAPVQAPTPEVTQLVNQINAGRRTEYDRIARSTGTPIEQVEQRAAQKIYDQLPRGTYVQAAGGRWTRK